MNEIMAQDARAITDKYWRKKLNERTAKEVREYVEKTIESQAHRGYTSFFRFTPAVMHEDIENEYLEDYFEELRDRVSWDNGAVRIGGL